MVLITDLKDNLVFEKDPQGQYLFFSNDELSLLEVPGAVHDKPQIVLEPNLKVIDTKITNLSGALANWGLLHALRDLGQNHVDEERLSALKSWIDGVPINSAVSIKFFVESMNKYLELNETRSLLLANLIIESDIKQIKISDQGKGYDHEILGYIYSEGKDQDSTSQFKTASKESGIDLPGGKFGEGQKVASAVIMKYNLDHRGTETLPIQLQFRSKCWRTTLEEKVVSMGEGKTAVSTTFLVKENEPYINGSETLIVNPPLELIQASLKIDQTILDFSQTPIHKYRTDIGYAFDWPHDSPPAIFIRGYSVVTLEELRKEFFLEGYFSKVRPIGFSFTELAINRDRDHILYSSDVKDSIANVLIHGMNSDWVKDLLTSISVSNSVYSCSFDQHYWEKNGNTVSAEFEILFSKYRYNYPEIRPENAQVFLDGFYKAFGADAIIATSSGSRLSEATQIAQMRGAKLVFLDACSAAFLAKLGAPTDIEKYELKLVKNYKLEIDISYKNIGSWGLLREIIKNHLDPSLNLETGKFDSISIQVELKDGTLIPISQILRVDKDDIVALHLSDFGKGYQHEHIAQWMSSKRDNETARYALGVHGEGLKIAAATAILTGHSLYYSSKPNSLPGWRAEAFAYPSHIGEHKCNNLGFHVYKSKIEYGSRTTLIISEDEKEREEILRIIFSLDTYIRHHQALGLSDSDPTSIFTSSDRRSFLVQDTDAQVYIRGVWIKKSPDELLMSYDFMDVPLNRDRDIPDAVHLKNAVGSLLAELTDINVIKNLLIASNKYPDRAYYEFQDLSVYQKFNSQKELWVKAFYELFGDSAVISSGSANALIESRYKGFTPIGVNSSFARMLKSCGVKDDKQALIDEYCYVNYNDLLAAEKRVLDCLKAIDREELLFPKRETNYKVFSSTRISDTPGKSITLGYCNITSGIEIGFLRSILLNPQVLLDTYIHEKCHQDSGAADGTREHFNAATKVLSRHVFNHPEKIQRLYELLSIAYGKEKVKDMRGPNLLVGFFNRFRRFSSL